MVSGDIVPKIKKKIDAHATLFNQNGAFFLSSLGRWNIKGSVSPANIESITGLFCSHKRKTEKASAKPLSLCTRCDPILFAPGVMSEEWGRIMESKHRVAARLHTMTP